MKKKKNDGSAVHEILKEGGLKIEGWEPANCGCGIEFTMPVIVDIETNERLDIERFQRSAVL